jgi:hypothetical protein
MDLLDDCPAKKGEPCPLPEGECEIHDDERKPMNILWVILVVILIIFLLQRV